MTEGIFEFEIEEGSAARGYHHEAAGADGRQGAGAVVTGVLQERRHLVVPPLLGGLPVRRIAPHALSGLTQLRTVSFPPSLRSVGAFALHNCPGLEEVALHDGITDYYNGVLRQDVRLQRVRLTISENNYTVMRDILSDSDAKLEFLLVYPEGEAHLLFPGYDYAFAENTMARTIQFSISGSGMVYRECVRRRGISFREYDRLFPRVIPDDPHAAVQIAADRLLYPHDLAPVHAQAYEDFLRANIGDVLLQFVSALAAEPDGTGAEETWQRLRLVADRGMITDEAADAALRLAAESGIPQLAGVILGGRETQASAASDGIDKKDDGIFSLDDW